LGTEDRQRPNLVPADYLTRIGDAFYVLHAFEKSSRKTDRRDLEIAKSRLRSVLAQLRTAKEEGDGQKD
jgi:phage-related protein